MSGGLSHVKLASLQRVQLTERRGSAMRGRRGRRRTGEPRRRGSAGGRRTGEQRRRGSVDGRSVAGRRKRRGGGSRRS